ncbi:hypothetical protein [Limosilactobacillus fermentum]|uniref:Uncharacterized protein n=1 Tax=Lactobacillus phage LF1 TaxID=947980 RepID=E9LUK8_9CAUD|nr:hypothetical protein [Limosilactobacillus fermentum]YP_007003230.1 hypothetical protein F374_gp30 [Lactobacillus phage LF1]ADW01254.1 hypothetical protein [Lactobacillus phage LF1]UVW04149.1 hypothetical protein NX839_03580 [Limosilactobacillus fermentum]WEN04766.1 hypothetical protein P0M30_06315 [Limosilactobacillus fermentum]WEN11621.1 hypothetical protein P0N62_06325 [Limosilactobacillus fermentum]WJD38276.1 hypothetical protein QRA02_06325 [Limosilactobacillus fermentum]
MKNNEIINCSPDLIIKRLKIISSNKLNADQSLIYFAGTIYSILLNRKVYKRNIDLQSFVKEYILAPIEEEQFKSYVYLSRTLLGSRIYRLIIEKYSYSLVIETSKRLFEYFETSSKEHNKKVKTNSKNIVSELSGWLKNDD